MALRCTLKQTGEKYEETNSDDRVWRCRYARHSYHIIRETDKRRGLQLRRLSCRLLRIADIALIVVKTAKPPDHCEMILTALRPAQIRPANAPRKIKIIVWRNSSTTCEKEGGQTTPQKNFVPFCVSHGASVIEQR